MLAKTRRALGVLVAAITLTGLASAALAETYYLVDDFGVQGKYRRCKYSNGKVYGLPATEPACYESIEGTSKPATQQQNTSPLPAAGISAFRNCSEARAAGAAPVRRGDPGYSKKLDRDGDGIGCE